MEDEEPRWSRETTWRQGRVLGADAASAACLAHEPDVCVLVISHDCDLAIDDLDIEPNVEVIAGRIVPSANGNLSWGKSTRKLHLTLGYFERTVVVELLSTEKHSVPKQLLARYWPDEKFTIDAHGLATLRRWLAARYNRTAFPDSFVARMKTTGLEEKLTKLLKPHGELFSFVYFSLDDGKLLEHNSGVPHELSIFLVYPAGDNPIKTGEAADKVASAVRDAFEDKLAGSDLISFRFCEPISEDDIVVSQAKLLHQWRLEYMTLRAKDDQPGPPL